jgi:hypothetical protein
MTARIGSESKVESPDEKGAGMKPCHVSNEALRQATTTTDRITVVAEVTIRARVRASLIALMAAEMLKRTWAGAKQRPKVI